MTANRPSDINLPQGWTWDRVEAERAKWDIADSMIPIATVPGACVAWGTINSVRLSAEAKLPPSMQGAVKILREKGHAVDVRQNQHGSLRYRVDGSRERTALETVNKYRHYGI